jgi:hypothetical protein
LYFGCLTPTVTRKLSGVFVRFSCAASMAKLTVPVAAWNTGANGRCVDDEQAAWYAGVPHLPELWSRGDLAASRSVPLLQLHTEPRSEHGCEIDMFVRPKLHRRQRCESGPQVHERTQAENGGSQTQTYVSDQGVIRAIPRLPGLVQSELTARVLSAACHMPARFGGLACKETMHLLSHRSRRTCARQLCQTNWALLGSVFIISITSRVTASALGTANRTSASLATWFQRICTLRATPTPSNLA